MTDKERRRRMGFVKTDIKTIEKNVFRMIGDEWALVTAKKDGQVNTMTVSWAAWACSGARR